MRNSMDPQQAHNLIQSQIAKLQTKLLDLTLKNPLLSTRFSERSNALIRVVDELPNVLAQKLLKDAMCIIPLPPMSDDPLDEKNPKFQQLLLNARISDITYLDTLSQIDYESDDAPDKIAQAERVLKNKIREELQLGQFKNTDISTVEQHAIANGISPSYELPLEDAKNTHKHLDKNIQTLLLPDFFEKRMTGLFLKYRTWLQETGINVMQVVLGFLEWAREGEKNVLSPLLLMPVFLDKKKSQTGYQYWISSSDDSIQINSVLAEKFKLDYGVLLPTWQEEDTPEIYLSKIKQLHPQGFSIWQVRRQIVVGVFPSMQLAMYHDLDPQMWKFSQHDLIAKLLTNATGQAVENADYSVDDPRIEAKIPCLITQADSSQASAIVDVMDGKNISIEGPPGTGKSQTIVNIIASFLSQGKKVLFVAEKTAALEVVRARLQAFGIGDFVLPMQVTQTFKGEVIDALRQRRELRQGQDPLGLNETLLKFKQIRDQLKIYIDLMTNKPFAAQTMHDLIWKSLTYQGNLISLPEQIKEHLMNDFVILPKEKMEELTQASYLLDKTYQDLLTHDNAWQNIGLANVDPFLADNLLNEVALCTQVYEELYQAIIQLPSFGLSEKLTPEALVKLKTDLQRMQICSLQQKGHILALARKIQDQSILEQVAKFLEESAQAQVLKQDLEKILHDPLDQSHLSKINQIDGLMREAGITSLSHEAHNQLLEEKQREVVALSNLIEIISIHFSTISMTFEKWIEMSLLIQAYPKEVLVLRKFKLDNASAKEDIFNAIAKSKLLLSQKRILEENFNLTPVPNFKEYHAHLAVLSGAGFFSFLSKKYRLAKQYFSKLSKSAWVNVSTALLSLKPLTQWLNQVDQFSQDSKLKERLGPDNVGIDSDFKKVILLYDFYDKVERDFSTNLTIQSFLKDADYDDLLVFSKINQLEVLKNLSTESIVDKEQFILKKKALEKNLQLIAINWVQINELIGTLPSIPFSQIDVPELNHKLLQFNILWNKLSTDHLMQDRLGDFFKGPETEKNDLTIAINLATLAVSANKPNYFFDLVQNENFDTLIELIDKIESLATKANSYLQNLSKKVNAKYLFDTNLNIKQLKDKLTIASQDKKGLINYSIFYALKKPFKDYGFGFLVEDLSYLQNKDLPFSKIFEAISFREMARAAYIEKSSEFSQFSGDRLNFLRGQLAELDEQIILLSREKLKQSLLRISRPPQGINVGKKTQWSELALIDNELTKKQRYLSLRELTRRAGRALLELKPCWMMSPLAVAQYIDKGSIEFDLVIIDEASQMTPENAIGALVRAKQAVVVGDTRQLPPGNFFNKMLEDETDDEEESITQESILELAAAVFKPSRYLKWHYRSRDPSLIAFCNEKVYDDRLVIFPTAKENDPTLGICSINTQGIYHTGTNPIEADQMIEAILHFMQDYPALSLGVVLLNQKQRDLMLNKFNLAINQNEAAQRYLEKWEKLEDGLSAFFIKNLENVQGDERDVIFIGTVYGPEKDQEKVMQRFGPINGAAGKRRLNVLFSRAKRKMVTFTSMVASDLKADESQNPGVWMLKQWLDYSANGGVHFDEVNIEPNLQLSDFQKYIMNRLQPLGYQVIPQIGVSGCFIDLGIKDPRWPHGFVMAIEGDGINYTGSLSAKDRDHLRPLVLQNLGWYSYRIWSIDWFVNADDEFQRLEQIINARLMILQGEKSHDS